MARIKLSVLVDSIRGTLAGSVLSSCRGSNYLKRSSAHGRQVRTSGQQIARGAISDLTGMWYGLSDVEKGLWTSLASMLGPTLTGISTFVKYNMTLLLYLGKSFINTTPFKTPGVPEFVKGIEIQPIGNGSFSVSWSAPLISSEIVLIKYWVMPGRADATIHRWTFGLTANSVAGTGTIDIPLNEGDVVHFRVRSFDLNGRLSPWSQDFKTAVSVPAFYGYSSYGWSYYGVGSS